MEARVFERLYRARVPGDHARDNAMQTKGPESESTRELKRFAPRTPPPMLAPDEVPDFRRLFIVGPVQQADLSDGLLGSEPANRERVAVPLARLS